MKWNLFLCLSVFVISYGFSQTIFNKDSLTVLADSLHNNSEYEKALLVRTHAIKLINNTSKEYQSYINAKYFHTNSSNLEFKSYNYHNLDKSITKKAREQYLDSALQSATKARDLYINAKYPDRIFQYQLQNRIYHQTAYLGNWKHALKEAQLGFKILKDTLSEKDKTFVDLIYDIGYIYSQLGDYSKAVKNYQTSLDLYKSIIGENHTDVAQAYNNIAVEYRNLGLRKKELESLLKAKSIWENIDEDDDKHFLYSCYGNLFYWYSYYGDYEKAEEYILKKKRLRALAKTTKVNGFLRNKEEIYIDKLSEWYDLMVHYSRKKDTINTIFYAQNILKSIPTDKNLLNFEVSKKSSTLKLYASLLKRDKPSEALRFLDKAISIQKNYKTKYYSDAFSYQLYKVELLIELNKYIEAESLLEELNDLSKNYDISNRFKLSIFKAKTAQSLLKTKKAQKYFDDAFLLLKNSDLGLEQIDIKDLKPLISFETIDGFLAMGDFYMEIYKNDDSKINFKKAIHRYLLASKIYNQLYLGQRYNERLFIINNSINDRLLNAASKSLENKSLLTKIINTIENNGSKLTWSKFVFSTQRQLLHLSQNLINEEESIKAQLNFYQNSIVSSKENSEEKIMLWKDKVYEWKESLSKIQDSIKQQSSTYHQFNIKAFDVATLQPTLKLDEGILKYILTEKDLYVFLILKENIYLLPSINKKVFVNTLKIGLQNLKNRNEDYQNSFKELKELLFNKINYQDYKKLTIIPDGALYYFPFEALLLDENMPLISYASSLMLYQEQNKTAVTFNKVNVGAFAVSNTNNRLPKTTTEIKNILNIFNGKAYINPSKNEFFKQASQYNVLHLAMHSNIDEVNPEFSSLNFYGEKMNKLLISELYNENFNANMAVLSACDTGNGFYENGEGVISLSRAFNYAGIPSTVMSLWKVDDEATEIIMTFFYKHLDFGETKDEALKNAKLDYLSNTEDPLLKHPYYWAGFVLTGNTNALVEYHNNWFYLLILPLLPIFIYRKSLFKFFKK
ncbi:CHAT domain-containing protein [Flaviramulus basaltis]|uniref:CHAT domain-containing protein n=1 Tax=Flaviramulus basaltis TaxID=369401 RepID=A0A1K2IAI8_9FLAO|nr:CHAT domain-containing tetratricopeptide repeat protein [Flaviramulus basaltis]SFZ89415.1 CHAT domain-containing protein [Flaviramulus basaltis]